MRRLLIVNVLLLAVVVGLVVQIVALWWRGEAEVESIVPRDAKAARSEVPPAVRRPPPPDLPLRIAEKDLFDPSRSAEKAAVSAAEASPVPPLNLVLLGVTVAGGGREALFRDQAQPKPLWLREGEEFSGYKIRRIDPRSVLMVTPTGDEVTLMINVEKKGAGAPTGPAGVQPTPHPAPSRPPHMTPQRVTTTPAPDVREKIERLREEARRRRQRPSQPRAEPQS